MSLNSRPLRSWLARSLRRLQPGRSAAQAAKSDQPEGLDPGLLTVPLHHLTPGRYTPTEAERRLRSQDEWFFNHCVLAARQVEQALGSATAQGARVLDIGCGDGIMALGLCRATQAEVVGCDVTRAFDTLASRTTALLPQETWPERLSFVQSQVNQPLPFDDAVFDAVYSWSVFEHVDSVPQLLREVCRVLKPEGRFFLQIEPLYHSPHGSHLQRLLNEPWAHLIGDEADYLARIERATDQVGEHEKDMLYRSNEFEAVKRYLVGEFRALNKVRTHELVAHVQAAGLTVDRCELGQVPRHLVPEALLRAHSAHDLRTNEIRLWLSRPAATSDVRQAPCIHRS